MQDDHALLRSLAPNVDSHLDAPLVQAQLIGSPRPRSHVWRCTLQGGATVIVKSLCGTRTPAYDPLAREATAPVIRLAREYAGAHLLSANGLGPHVLSVNAQAGYIVLEDLGQGTSLAEALLDPNGNPASAGEALTRYARALAEQHATTLGQQHAFATAMAEIVPGTTEVNLILADAEHNIDTWLRDDVAHFERGCEGLGVHLGTTYRDEVHRVAAALAPPNPWWAFSTGDNCPDNHIISPIGQLRFLDFESGVFRHALLDTAYLRMAFPTCWCVQRLPAIAIAEAEAAYRAQLTNRVPLAMDDTAFFTGLCHACSFWAIRTLALRPDRELDLTSALAKEIVWGRSTTRQRHVLRLQAAHQICAQQGQLPSLANAFDRLASTLRDRWGPSAEMPLYPPYNHRTKDIVNIGARTPDER